MGQNESQQVMAIGPPLSIATDYNKPKANRIAIDKSVLY